MAQLALTMGKQCIFVRNKCIIAGQDIYDDDDGDIGHQGWKEFIKSDKQLLEGKGFSSPQVVGDSAWNIICAKSEYRRGKEESQYQPVRHEQFEWSKLMNLIDGAAELYSCGNEE
jgi:hypothetical protein